MTSLYLASLAFGGLLIGVSVLLGGGDLDGDGDLGLEGDLDLDGDLDFDGELDLDGDVDLDGDGPIGEALATAGDSVGADAAIWMPFLSLRFWTFATAAFGMIGLLLSFVMSSAVATAGFAGLGGMSIGWGAAWSFRHLAQKPVSGETTTLRYVGQEAKVVLSIRPGAQGKIALQTYQGRLDLTAVSNDGRSLDVGDTVLIASMSHGVANVTRLTPGPRPIAEGTQV
jgi:hypothetical protein